MKAVDIKWDVTDEILTDEEQEDILAELPTEVEIPEDIDEDLIDDWLSGEYGYFNDGFVLEEKAKDRIKRVNKTWCEDDIAAALRHWDIPATKENIEKVTDQSFLNSFRRALIETGNDFLRSHVSYVFGNEAK